MKKEYLWSFFGVVIIILLIVLIVKVSNNKEVENTFNCKGEYIEHEGSCCLDTNYNYVCDNQETNLQPKNDGVILNIVCEPFNPCNFNRGDYLGDGELDTIQG